MNYPYYDVQESPSRLHFEFTSEGPNSSILKVVDYAYMDALGLWNLGFGDYDPVSDTVNDKVVSDNGDGRKVIATVFFTLNEFFAEYPEATVFFTGSTNLRTEVYGRIIKQNLQHFPNRFVVEGVNKDGSTEVFNSHKLYSAFLISLLRN